MRFVRKHGEAKSKRSADAAKMLKCKREVPK